MNDHPEPRWWCAVAGEMSATRACDDTEWEHSLCGWRSAASSPDEPQYVGACQVTSTSGVCVLGTAGCITRHILEAMRSASSPGEASDDRHRNTWDGSCSRCGMGNEYVDQHAPDCPASADEGARQRPDTAALLVIADWLVRTLPGHRGAEQTAATLAYTARWIDAQPPVPPTPTPCPYIVTGGEGTSHCSLAERSAPVERPQPDEQR